jgi:hypothetical protein
MYRVGIFGGFAVFIVGALEWLLLMFHYTEFLERLRPLIGEASPARCFTVMVVGIIVFATAWLKRAEEIREASSSGVVPSGGVTQTANPSLTASPSLTQVGPTINIHPNPVATPLPETKPPELDIKPTSTHNVRFVGVRATRFDDNLIQEVFDVQSGVIGLKACFLNQSIPGTSVSTFRYVKARVVYRHLDGSEITENSRVVWLGHGNSRHVHLGVNHRECIMVALKGGTAWVVPFTRWHRSEFGESSELDGEPLPDGKLEIEITLVDGNGVGLEPALIRVELHPNGTVTEFYRATPH